MNNKHHYELAVTVIEGVKWLIFRRCIGSLINEEKITTLNNDTVRVRLEALKNENGENIYCFSYNRDENWIKAGEGEVAYLTTEVGGKFTGNYIALYASGNGKENMKAVKFDMFDYKGMI